MDPIELPIKNFPAQQKIFTHPARYKIVVKGRRFGLTRGAANDFIKAALNDDFKQGLWVDTVVTNINRYVERYFQPALKKLPPEIHWKWRKQEKILEIKDAYIDFRSVDRPENIEGFGYDKVFLNEAGIILKDEYLWHNAITPMLWDFEPQIVIGGTPKGRGIFYDLAEKGKDPTLENYKFFHFTSYDNPYLNEQLLKEEIEQMPERVKEQEVFATFLDETGVVFRNIHEIAIARPSKPINGRHYTMGVDLAKHEDYTVIAVYDTERKEQVYQLRFNQLDWPFQKRRIRETAKHFNNALVSIDASGLGDPIADDLTRDGVNIFPVKFTNAMKKELVEKLVIFAEQHRIKILRINETLKEFTNFTYDVTGSGNIRYSAPQGMHDDIVMAHALAVHCLYENKSAGKPRKKGRIARELERRTKAQEQEDDDYNRWYY